MRRSLLTLSAVFVLAVLANPVNAQFKIGAQGALISSIDQVAASLDQARQNGTLGAGGRIMLDPPLFPLALVGSAIYYFPDCTGDCSYYTASIAANLRLPMPVISPYVLGGWQIRRRTENGVSTDESGPMVGVGLQLNFGLSLFLEGTMEFNSDNVTLPTLDNDPIVIKGGILIG
jgi:hypothetical protein